MTNQLPEQCQRDQAESAGDRGPSKVVGLVPSMGEILQMKLNLQSLGSIPLPWQFLGACPGRLSEQEPGALPTPLTFPET